MQKFTDEKQPRTTQIIFGEYLPVAKEMAKRNEVSVSKYIRDLVKRDHEARLRRERREALQMAELNRNTRRANRQGVTA